MSSKSRQELILRDSTLLDIILWLLRRRQRFCVVGHSMQPLLQPGEWVLVNRAAYRRSRPKVGQLVALKHPLKPHLTLVKCLVAIDTRNYYVVEGLNPAASTDSRHFGPIPLQALVGEVLCRFH